MLAHEPDGGAQKRPDRWYQTSRQASEGTACRRRLAPVGPTAESMRIGNQSRTVNTHRERIRWESRRGGLFHGYIEQPSPAKAFVVHVRSFICEMVKASNKKGGIGRKPTLDLDGRRVAACFHDAAKENGDVFYLGFGEDWRMLTSEIRLWLGRGWNLYCAKRTWC